MILQETEQKTIRKYYHSRVGEKSIYRSKFSLKMCHRLHFRMNKLIKSFKGLTYKKKVNKFGSRKLLGNGIDSNKVGALRGQLYTPSKK